MKTYLGYYQRNDNARFYYGRCQNYRLAPTLTALVNQNGDAATIDPLSGNLTVDVDGTVAAADDDNEGGLCVQNSGYARVNDPDALDVTLTWDWGDGSELEETNFDDTDPHTYEDPGSYEALFLAQDGLGRVTTQSFDIEVSTTPGTPQNLEATPGDTQITLDWDDVEGNDVTYSVHRSLTEGGPYTEIVADLVASTYINTGLTNGTPYYYVVTAVANDISSADSDEATATPSA